MSKLSLTITKQMRYKFNVILWNILGKVRRSPWKQAGDNSSLQLCFCLSKLHSEEVILLSCFCTGPTDTSPVLCLYRSLHPSPHLFFLLFYNSTYSLPEFSCLYFSLLILLYSVAVGERSSISALPQPRFFFPCPFCSAGQNSSYHTLFRPLSFSPSFSPFVSLFLPPSLSLSFFLPLALFLSLLLCLRENIIPHSPFFSISLSPSLPLSFSLSLSLFFPLALSLFLPLSFALLERTHHTTLAPSFSLFFPFSLPLSPSLSPSVSRSISLALFPSWSLPLFSSA
ncbi:hypothetical protein NQD34_018416 [Periophthalmus magnuspinnatus]|nr:hypothetical protein NQD34_018416 [Periophthalmus magnuspinnatus]